MEGLYAGFKEEKKTPLGFLKNKVSFSRNWSKMKNDVTFGIIKALKQKRHFFLMIKKWTLDILKAYKKEISKLKIFFSVQ